MVKKKITIYGKGKGKRKVHNVGYRLFLLEQADSLFIEEFDAKNVTVDDLETLIVLVAGEDSQLAEFIDFVNNPLNRPEEAIVDNIIVENWEGRVREIDKFRQSFNTIQLGKIVKTGLYMCKKQDVMIGKQDVMIGKQDVMIGKQDVMIGKQDMMIGKQDMMIGKQDVMIGKQEETIGEIRNLRDDLKLYFDKRFEILEKDVFLIKKKMCIA